MARHGKELARLQVRVKNGGGIIVPLFLFVLAAPFVDQRPQETLGFAVLLFAVVRGRQIQKIEKRAGDFDGKATGHFKAAPCFVPLFPPCGKIRRGLAGGRFGNLAE